MTASNPGLSASVLGEPGLISWTINWENCWMPPCQDAGLNFHIFLGHQDLRSNNLSQFVVNKKGFRIERQLLIAVVAIRCLDIDSRQERIPREVVGSPLGSDPICHNDKWLHSWCDWDSLIMFECIHFQKAKLCAVMGLTIALHRKKSEVVVLVSRRRYKD